VELTGLQSNVKIAKAKADIAATESNQAQWDATNKAMAKYPDMKQEGAERKAKGFKNRAEPAAVGPLMNGKMNQLEQDFRSPILSHHNPFSANWTPDQLPANDVAEWPSRTVIKKHFRQDGSGHPAASGNSSKNRALPIPRRNTLNFDLQPKVVGDAPVVYHVQQRWLENPASIPWEHRQEVPRRWDPNHFAVRPTSPFPDEDEGTADDIPLDEVHAQLQGLVEEIDKQLAI